MCLWEYEGYEEWEFFHVTIFGFLGFRAFLSE